MQTDRNTCDKNLIAAMAMENDWLLTDVEVLEGQPALGKGAYGTVYRARWIGIEVAAKRVHENLAVPTNGINGATNVAVQGIEEEGERMQRLRHPHLVQFLGVYYDDLKRLHLVMEKMEQSLADLLERSREPLFDMKIYSIGADVASALRYMHELPTPIAHRDLTPKNILLTSDLRAKVSDLGACKHVLKLHAPMTATLAPGNPKYMPPEALDGGGRYAKYAPTAVDAFSFGIVLLEMFSGIDPEPSSWGAFLRCPSDPAKFIRVPEEERRSACFEKIAGNHPLTELILTCVDADHSQRPTMRQIQDSLLDLQGKNVPRVRSKPLQSAAHTIPREKTHPMKRDIYDDVVPAPRMNHPYENISSTHARTNTPPTLPPKGERNSPQHAADTHAAQERMMSKHKTPRQAAAASRQQSLSPDSLGANQPGYEPLRVPFNDESQNGSEGVDTKICQDNYQHLGLVRSCNESVYEKPIANLPQTRLKRAETGPIIRVQEKVKLPGRAPRTVYQSQGVEPGPDLPPLPPWLNPRKSCSLVTDEEPPVYDIIEEVETVLKVTEPFRKRNSKSHNNVAQKNSPRLAALCVSQNELLVTLGRMSGQNEMIHARNTEGKFGVIADTQVQVVKPVTFNYLSGGSPGIFQHVTYGKMGTKPKIILLSSSKIAKGNLETLTSLANTDVVAVDRPSNGGNAFFQIDFLKQRLVRVEGYLLQWTAVIGRFGYPLQWVVEVSLDGKAWKEVGKEEQQVTTKTSQYWAVRQQSLGRYLRISLLGTNSEGNHMLCLNGIELYGDLYSSLDDQYI